MVKKVKRDSAYLWDMLDAAKTAMEMAGGIPFPEYERNRQLQLAVERLVEIIGETARSVSKSLKDSHPEIPWELIVAQRHVIAHDYGDIKQDKIWMLIQKHIPDLVTSLEKLIPPAPKNDE